jgi:hypothetical protein
VPDLTEQQRKAEPVGRTRRRKERPELTLLFLTARLRIEEERETPKP